jgi:two-component system response regulator YesN
MRLRVEKAKELMGSNKKLYDIAASVGYDNVQYFSTIFKEIEGVAPSQYRNLL